MNIIIMPRFVLMLFLSWSMFILGNLVYSTILSWAWYYRSIVSELCFVLMYTIIDHSHFRYKYKFTVAHVATILVCFLPNFEFLFYNIVARNFSISIAILAILINSNLLHYMHSKKLMKVICSRISTTIASIVEILLFSFILSLGLKGAILMSFLRLIYVITIPKIIFRRS